MQHLLVDGIERAFGWSGPSGLGSKFVRGRLPDPRLCARLLTPHRLLDIAMRRSLSPPQFRCLQEGHELHPREYIATTRTRRGQTIPMVDMHRLAGLLDAGVTLVLDATDTFDPTMEVACRALQWWAGELVQVNAYLTSKDAAGFDLHWDDHDVLVVQLAGEKSWEVRGASRPVPMFRDAEPNISPSENTEWAGTMMAGDVMHIPRGFWHRATRADRAGNDGESGFSLHVTFGISARTGVDWVSWLADRAREQELFRHDLAHPVDPAAQAAALCDGVAGLAATRSPAEFLASRRREHRSARHVSTSAAFGAPERVVCIAEFPPAVAIDADGSVTVVAAGRRLRFAAAALPALRQLLSGHPVVVADVAVETGVDATRIAELLLRENVCAEASPELCSGYTGLLTIG